MRIYSAEQEHQLIGDAERQRTTQILTSATSQGYLTVAEFEQRSGELIQARYAGQLNALVADLPQQLQQLEKVGGKTTVVATSQPVKKNSLVHSSGLAQRTGLFVISSIAMFGLAGATGTGWYVLMIPVLAILLYVLKVGPASWYHGKTEQLTEAEIDQRITALIDAKAQLRSGKLR